MNPSAFVLVSYHSERDEDGTDGQITILTSLCSMIAITAVVSGLFHVILFPSTVLLGASGIVFMMIVLSSVAGMKDGKIPLTSYWLSLFITGARY